MFDWLLEYGDFVTRDHCGTWPQWMSRTYIAANALIAVAYLLIAVMLYALYRRQRITSAVKVSILSWFAAFIFLCGVTHVTDIAAFHWPAYRLYTLIFAATAIASIGTAIVLPGAILAFLKLPHADEVINLNATLQERVLRAEAAQSQLKQHNAMLGVRLANLEMLLETEGWTASKALALAEMRGALAGLKEVSFGS